MNLRGLLTPTINCLGSILDLDLIALKAQGIQGLVLDFDDTLVPLGAKDVDPAVAQWVANAKTHFQVCIVSNNPNYPFLNRIGNGLGLLTISAANKPSRKALRKVIQQMNLLPQEVAIIGDRLLTDIVGGNRMGMITILVHPPGPKPVFGRGELLRRFEQLLARQSATGAR